MKTKNILLAMLCIAFLLPATAQQKETPAKKKIRISLIKDENGKKTVVEKEFTSEAELEKFMEDNREDFPRASVPCMPPVPSGCKRTDSLQRKRVMIIDKEIRIKDGEEKEDITIRHLDKDDNVLLEDMRKELKDKDGDEGEEKIIIIRKTRSEAGEKEEIVPGNISIEEKAGPANVSNMSFFPNPNRGNFHIQFNVSEPADVLLHITDMSGKTVYTDEIKNFNGWYEKDIYRGDLSDGSYLMNVTAGAEKKTLKVSIQK